MKRVLRPPRFLSQVLQAIHELKETGGSNSNRIVSHVKSTLIDVDSPSTLRNLSTQVLRALKHAATNGIVKQRAGKFRINTAFLRPFKDINACKRRRRRKSKKRGRRRRRRGRRHSIAPKVRTHSSYGHGSDSESFYGQRSDSESEDLPFRELKRRRRKGGKGKKKRRRRRRVRRHTTVASRNPSKLKIDQDHQNIIYPDDHKEEDNIVLRDESECDNPDCLCNVKDEVDEMQNYDPPM